MSADTGYRSLRELLRDGQRAPLHTRPATASEQRPPTTVLAAPRVPAFDADHDEPTRSGHDMSPHAIVALAMTDLDQVRAGALAALVRHWVELDSDAAILAMALVKKLHEGATRAG